MILNYIQSKNIKDYEKINSNLLPDFGEHFEQSISYYCNNDYELNKYWEIYLVKHNEEIIGICGLYSLTEINEELWLGWFGLLPELRNKNIGGLIINHLKLLCKNLGAKKLMSYVDSNGKALNFYYRNDFKLIGTVGEYIKKNNLNKYNFEDEKDFVIYTNI
jgi:GNAT superfamily N-acetyltransferase